MNFCRFTNGRAQGQVLSLQRAPQLLRVVTDGKKWDALDQLQDTMRQSEIAVVYRKVHNPAPIRGFIDGRDYRGPFVEVEYREHESQPPQALMRDNEAWRQWCQEQLPPA